MFLSEIIDTLLKLAGEGLPRSAGSGKGDGEQAGQQYEQPANVPDEDIPF